MVKIDTHLFLVDGELIPNITPALDERFRPGKVYLLTTEGNLHAQRLKRLLERACGVEVDFWLLRDQWSIEHIRQRVQEFVDATAGVPVALNATCGTKPMSLAAYEVFQDAGRPVYYVHPAIDRVVWLNPRDRDSFNLADRIKLPDYFSANDLRITGCKTGIATSGLNTLTDKLVGSADYFADALAMVNGYAAYSKGTLLSPSVSHKHLKFPRFRKLLQLFADKGLLELVDSGNDAKSIRFTGEDSRFYVNGGWLEEHVYGLLCELREGGGPVQDLARNVVFEWDENASQVTNEIDVAFLADNRLYLVECKTMQFDKLKSPAANANQVLYKLNTLREYLGGKKARAMFVSFWNLSNSPRERAAEFNIELCDAANLASLAARLKSWVNL